MDYTWLAVALLVVVCMVLALKVLAKPARWAGLVFFRVVIGVATLSVLNLASPWSGVHLPVNPISSAIVGLLGVPGIGLLYALQRLLMGA